MSPNKLLHEVGTTVNSHQRDWNSLSIQPPEEVHPPEPHHKKKPAILARLQRRDQDQKRDSWAAGIITSNVDVIRMRNCATDRPVMPTDPEKVLLAQAMHDLHPHGKGEWSMLEIYIQSKPECERLQACHELLLRKTERRQLVRKKQEHVKLRRNLNPVFTR